MLPAIRGGVRRLRWVAVVLAVIAPLAFPGAASADNNGATAEALQYVSTSVAPVTGSDAEYDNQAAATQTSDGQTAFSLTFKYPMSYASVITAENNANATVNSCQNCAAVAISFQLVIASQQDLAEVTANDAANAADTGCTNCNTLAEAFQIVYAPSSEMAWNVIADIGKLQLQLEALKKSGLSLSQIQSTSTKDVNAIMTEMEKATLQGAQMTPMINSDNLPAELTTQQPFLKLLSAFHH